MTRNDLVTGCKLLLEYENETRIALAYADQLLDSIRHDSFKGVRSAGLDLAISNVRNNGLHAFVLQHVSLDSKLHSV